MNWKTRIQDKKLQPAQHARNDVKPYTTCMTSHPLLPCRLQINEIKDWLTDNGFEADVFELNKQKPKKDDWVKLVQSKCAGSRP